MWTYRTISPLPLRHTLSWFRDPRSRMTDSSSRAGADISGTFFGHIQQPFRMIGAEKSLYGDHCINIRTASPSNNSCVMPNWMLNRNFNLRDVAKSFFRNSSLQQFDYPERGKRITVPVIHRLGPHETQTIEVWHVKKTVARCGPHLLNEGCGRDGLAIATFAIKSEEICCRTDHFQINDFSTGMLVRTNKGRWFRSIMRMAARRSCVLLKRETCANT